MAQLDPKARKFYLGNTLRYLSSLRAARARWEKTLAPLRGKAFLSYHRSLSYLADWLGLRIIAELEPRPGIPPNPGHIARVLDRSREQQVVAVLQEVWFPQDTSQQVAQRLNVPLLVLPTQPQFTKGQSYLDSMDHLVSLLVPLAKLPSPLPNAKP